MTKLRRARCDDKSGNKIKPEKAYKRTKYIEPMKG